jgi:predicted O-methyltransferase YrrM
MSANTANEYRFTQWWFDEHVPVWQLLWDHYKPKHVLEIGAFEGRATFWMAEHIKRTHGCGWITVVDPWLANETRPNGEPWPHAGDDVFDTFLHNKRVFAEKYPGTVTVEVLRERSITALARRLEDFEDYDCQYDFVYVDGAHDTRSVLEDGLMAFRLLRPGGVIVFDDYLWRIDRDVLHTPRLAVELFALMLHRDVAPIRTLNTQAMFEKRPQPEVNSNG